MTTDRRRTLRALHALVLIALSQVPTTSARPHRVIQTTTIRVLDPNCSLEGRPPAPIWPSVPGIEYTFVPRPTSSELYLWNPEAYQIEDGQVQVSAAVSTEVTGVTSLSSTFLSSSEVTRFYTYTPVPRQDTSKPPMSTSTTTIFVTASPISTAVPSSTSTSASAGTTPNVPLPAPLPTSTTSAGAGTSTSTAAPAPVQSYTTSVPEGLLTSLTTSEVQTVTAAPPENTTGAVHTPLETSGNPTKQPFPSLSLNGSTSLSLINTETLSGVGPTAKPHITSISAANIFQPIASDAPPAQIQSRADHPVPRLGIQQQQQRLQTNKFYGNFYLGGQTGATWTHPYSVSWSAGQRQTYSFGLAISHVELSQASFGQKTSSDAGDSAYFANLLGIQSLVLSAIELGNGTTLTTDSLEAFSVNVNLIPAGGTLPAVTFPLCQGMGFVTGSYNSVTPLIESGIGIESVTYAGAVVKGTTFKYRALLSSGVTWLIYVTPRNTGYQENSFTLVSPVSIQGPPGFGGYIQIAKVPTNVTDAEDVYDGSAGVYPTSIDISGSVAGTEGTYTLSWTKEGPAGQPLLMFALPHHLESLASTDGVTDVMLQTTTKGVATAVQADSWTLVEPDLPIGMAFNPWSPTGGDLGTLPLDAIEAINAAGTTELAQDMAAQTNVGSMYYDGKALAKFAAIVYVIHDMAHNVTLALTGLQELQNAFALHVDNMQKFPLVYDTAWGGATSISTYLSGNSGDDFGNTYYNDHHFHYGYFLYAAAVIGYLDPTWLDTGTSKAWVNMLARDYANSVTDDTYFPFSRSFDWYHGHSWAQGVVSSADGKNQESSSEDTMASYGLKMWGKVINDKNMEARGNLMLAVQARSLQHYYLYTDDNTVEPAQFIGNKVSGILFENKIHHTTYFGSNIEYIQGIHMLPLMPFSTLIRTPTFVQQEWDAYGFATYAPTLGSGWEGVLMANLAIIDPETSYAFFSRTEFDYGLLDGGASRTWYLAWSAALRQGSYGSNTKS
ncbi:endo-1,3-beta glucanase [Saxophila tyrrhenica]|uniref:glucan endo-1,3-beta-D-glucosidase n=1 Tax=Saxophila tyrrhenica TaxID=1690608 RepID=A0AAV9PJG2_9PEZI|nr:endo-1,3-beta glucanase [Saxophila tyrrhenica]